MAKPHKRKRWPLVAALLAFALGVGCIAYPYVSDWTQKQFQGQIIKNQYDTVQNTANNKLTEEFQQAQLYNTLLLKNRTVLTDPFDPNNQPVTSEQYESLLNLNNDGVMGTLYIPEIKLQVPIYHGTSDEVLQKGAGHMEGTSLPVGGDDTHAVLAGHNGLPAVRIFDDIDQLKQGDYFIVNVLGEDHAYGVTSKETVLPSETNSLVAEAGKDQVTLVTCTPYGVNTHRLLVHAERIDVPQAWLDRDKKDDSSLIVVARNIPLWLFSLAGVAAAIGVAFIILLVKKRRKDDDDDDNDKAAKHRVAKGNKKAGSSEVLESGQAQATSQLPPSNQVPTKVRTLIDKRILEHNQALADSQLRANRARTRGSAPLDKHLPADEQALGNHRRPADKQLPAENQVQGDKRYPKNNGVQDGGGVPFDTRLLADNQMLADRRPPAVSQAQEYGHTPLDQRLLFDSQSVPEYPQSTDNSSRSNTRIPLDKRLLAKDKTLLDAQSPTDDRAHGGNRVCIDKRLLEDNQPPTDNQQNSNNQAQSYACIPIDKRLLIDHQEQATNQKQTESQLPVGHQEQAGNRVRLDKRLLEKSQQMPDSSSLVGGRIQVDKRLLEDSKDTAQDTGGAKGLYYSDTTAALDLERLLGKENDDNQLYNDGGTHDNYCDDYGD